MKKYILYIISIGFLLGCGEDFLTETPMTKKADKNFYMSNQDVYEALMGCYKVLQKEEFGSFWHISEIASDNCFLGTGASEGKIGWDDWEDYNNEELCYPLWQKDYKGIFRCNSLIVNVEDKTWEDEKLINTYLGEAHFLRAYFYFELVRVFGHVPLFDKPEYDKYREQADPKDVYTLIANDLLFAIDNIPGKSYVEDDPESGRVTKWAAQSLLARVFLYYTGYYSEPDLAGVVNKDTVIVNIQDVIENSGHGLVEDFRTLWAYSLNTEYLEKLADTTGLEYQGEGNKETVFAIKFSITGIFPKNDGSHWIIYNGLRSYTKDPIAAGWGFAPVNPKLWNEFPDDDPRKTSSILSIEGEGMSGYTAGDQNEETGYWQKKYIPVSIDNEDRVSTLEYNWQFGQPYDFIAIRFADVLLMGAELLLDTDAAKAQEYLNLVRNRAYKGNAPAVTVSKETIMNERRFELAFEAVRYWDLLRQGLDVAKAAIDEPGVILHTGGLKKEHEITKVIDFPLETMGLFQIPVDEIRLSAGTIKQNIGWE